MNPTFKSLGGLYVLRNRAILAKTLSNMRRNVSRSDRSGWCLAPTLNTNNVMSRELSTFGAPPSGISDAKESDIVRGIKEIIEDKIRPTIQEDGGDIEFVSYENSIVRVRLQGACRTCPSSIITLKNGVKSMLQYHIPEILDVEQVEEDE